MKTLIQLAAGLAMILGLSACDEKSQTEKGDERDFEVSLNPDPACVANLQQYQNFVPTEIFVAFNPAVSVNEQLELFREYAANVISETPGFYFRVRVPAGQEIAYACTIERESIVNYVDLNIIVEPN